MVVGGHIFSDLTVQISCSVTIKILYNHLSKYTIEPDSRVPLFMACHFSTNNIVYDILHHFKLRQNAPLDDLFIVLFSQQFQLPKHRFKLRKNAQLSDLVFKIFLAVLTS